MPIQRYNPSSPHPDRAAQAWVVLVAAAMNRQTLTYLGLSKLMYRKSAQGVLDKILGQVALFCEENDLPALTTLVVGKSRGTPGREIPVDRSRLDELREQVYEFDWFDVRPPTPEEVRSLAQGMKARKP
jgi:hypothetical protein